MINWLRHKAPPEAPKGFVNVRTDALGFITCESSKDPSVRLVFVPGGRTWNGIDCPGFWRYMDVSYVVTMDGAKRRMNYEECQVYATWNGKSTR